jgi:hypothetical protein
VINRSLQQPKGKSLKQSKPSQKMGKNNPKAHEVTEKISAESSSCNDGVSLTENVFATQTENEGMLPIIQCGLIF